MADRLWRVQVTIPMDTAIPQDAVTNTFYFDDDDDPLWSAEQTFGRIVDRLDAFYAAFSVDLFPVVVGNVATVRAYDMAAPEPRVQVDQGTFPIATGASGPLPSEVALCASFSADLASGDNPKRRRGRLYLGPVAESAVSVINGYSRPQLSLRESIRDAMDALATPDPHDVDPGWFLNWAVYSPTTHAASTVGEAFNDVRSGWVDDAWDTQRRRGVAPTARVTFDNAP